MCASIIHHHNENIMMPLNDLQTIGSGGNEVPPSLLLQAEDEDDEIEELEEPGDLHDVEMHDGYGDSSQRSTYSSSHNTTPTSPSFAPSHEVVSYSYEEDKSLIPLEERFPFLKDDRKRTRKLLSPDQTRILEAILERTVYPSTPLREAVARQLGIPPRKVQIWFQNKRQGRRRQSVSDDCTITNGTGSNNHSSSNGGGVPGIDVNAGTATSPIHMSIEGVGERNRRHQSRERCLEMQSKADDMRLAVLRDEQGRQFAELRLDASYCDGEQHPAPNMGNIMQEYNHEVNGGLRFMAPIPLAGNAMGLHAVPQTRSLSWHPTAPSSGRTGAPPMMYGSVMQRAANLSDHGGAPTMHAVPRATQPHFAGQSQNGSPQYAARVHPYSHNGNVPPQHPYHSRHHPSSLATYTYGSPAMYAKHFVQTESVSRPPSRPVLQHSMSYSTLQQHMPYRHTSSSGMPVHHANTTAAYLGAEADHRSKPRHVCDATRSPSSALSDKSIMSVGQSRALHNQRIALHRRSTIGASGMTHFVRQNGPDSNGTTAALGDDGGRSDLGKDDVEQQRRECEHESRPHLPKSVNQLAPRASGSMENLRVLTTSTPPPRRKQEPGLKPYGTYRDRSSTSPLAYSVTRCVPGFASPNEKSTLQSSASDVESDTSAPRSRQETELNAKSPHTKSKSNLSASASVDSAMLRPQLSQMRIRSFTTTLDKRTAAASTKSPFVVGDESVCLPPIKSESDAKESAAYSLTSLSAAVTKAAAAVAIGTSAELGGEGNKKHIRGVETLPCSSHANAHACETLPSIAELIRRP